MPTLPRPLRRPAAAAALLAAAACRPPAAAAPAPTPAVAPTTGDALLEAMRARYAGRWYRTATFVQRTTLAPPGGGAERRETWYEAMQLPGRLRIDRDSTLRSGTLFANDSQYVVVNGTFRRAVPGYNALLVLGFDVYGQPAARTAAALRTLGLPAGPVRADTWQGRPVWVVGGAPGDLRSAQYWVDQERLVFVRLLQPYPGDASQTYDVRFDAYRRLGGGWIAERVEALVGGRRTLLEEYSDVRADVELDPTLFDARRWTAARHWRQAR